MRSLTSDTAAAEKWQDEEIPSGPTRGTSQVDTSQVEEEESFLALHGYRFLQGMTSLHSLAT